MSDQVATVIEPVGGQRWRREPRWRWPGLIVDAGPAAAARFLEFFAARIANRRTRAA